LANKQVAIDMPAGPSELAVIADESCIPSYVAADLLSQAEHGPDSQVVLISNCKDVIQNVKKELDGQLNLLPRKQIAERALTNSKLILVQNLQQAIDFSNFYAPEHLIIAAENAEALAEQVLNAGSVFIGNFSCESAGDYASGTNHTLPTNGFAKAYSGVSVDSFVKKITFQNVSPSGLLSIGNAIEIMAQAEGLDAHKNAVTIRLKDILKKNGN
jgi:histidinol dehydrogenase